MKFVILGAGALGSVLSAHLARAGEDVTLLARGARAKFLQQHGVKVSGLAEITAALTVVDDPREVSEADVLVVTVKTYDTESALEALRHVNAGVVFSVQNGVMKDEQLAAVFGNEATIGAVADFSAEIMPDGIAKFTRNEGLFLGELPSGVSDRVSNLVARIAAAGIKTVAAPDILSIEWSKFVAWMSVGPVAALSRLESHRLLQDPDLASVHVQLARETAKIAVKLGIPVDDVIALGPAKSLSTLTFEDAVELAMQNGRQMEARGIVSHRMSILQDLEAGKRMEVEETVGYALRRGLELGIDMPATETCYRLMAGLDRSARATSA